MQVEVDERLVAAMHGHVRPRLMKGSVMIPAVGTLWLSSQVRGAYFGVVGVLREEVMG